MPAVRPSALLSATLVVAARLGAQGAPSLWNPEQILRTERFVKPPAEVERLIMTPRVDISFTNQSPDGRWFLRATGTDRGDIRAFGAPHIWLGGLQIDTRAHRARSLTTSTRTGLSVTDPRTGTTRALKTPAGASISAPIWSPTSRQVAYLANFPSGTYVYVADVASGVSRRVSERPVLATVVTDLVFTADGRHVATVLVPIPRASEPTHGEGDIEDGPQVRLTGGRAVPQPVHFSLLQDVHDQALLRYHTTGQVALIDVTKGTVRSVGAPTMVRDLSPSADGAHLRVTRMTEPFSYLVPVSSFGSVEELWDASGKVVATLATTPLRESARDGAPSLAAATSDSARRALQWNPIGPGLLFIRSESAPAAPAPEAAALAPEASAPVRQEVAPPTAVRPSPTPLDLFFQDGEILTPAPKPAVSQTIESAPRATVRSTTAASTVEEELLKDFQPPAAPPREPAPLPELTAIIAKPPAPKPVEPKITLADILGSPPAGLQTSSPDAAPDLLPPAPKSEKRKISIDDYLDQEPPVVEPKKAAPPLVAVKKPAPSQTDLGLGKEEDLGRFKGTEPALAAGGENLDVPTWQRLKNKLRPLGLGKEVAESRETPRFPLR